ncbi:hypothetical protein EJB05_30680, partial [Eragrostis curvula]
MWRQIWKLSIPSKLKNFVWRLAHNTLAVRGNLEHRGMKIAKKCVVCSRSHEDGGHLFFKCKLAKTVWLATNLEHVRAQLVSFGSAKDVVITILEILKFFGKDEGASRGLKPKLKWERPSRAMQMGIGKIVLETDALLVKQAIETYSHESSQVGTLISELRNLLDLDFIDAKVEYRPRDCNKVAHSLEAL